MNTINLNPWRHQDRCIIVPEYWTDENVANLVWLCHHNFGVHTDVEIYPGGYRVIWILLNPGRCAAILAAHQLCERDEPDDFPAYLYPEESSLPTDLSPPSNTAQFVRGQLPLF